MALVLGIESSCDDVGVAVYDTSSRRLLSNTLFSQMHLHEEYGGVVPEIASRAHLEKIDVVTQQALTDAGCTLEDLTSIAVTSSPGLVGSLLVGVCFAKGLAWAAGKKLIGVNHLEGHIFSSFLTKDGMVNSTVIFPHINLSVSGGHTSMYLVHDFGRYELLGQTTDDAAGEAFDKVAKMLGFGYPGGPIIERLAQEVDFIDTAHYPRTKNLHTNLNFSFSGIKTAVLYDLVRRGVYEIKVGPLKEYMTYKVQQEVSSSLLVCIGDIFEAKLKKAFKEYPEITGCTFVGGVACNKYLKKRLAALCENDEKWFISPPATYCVDNGAMIAFVGGYKTEQGLFSSLDLDVFNYV